MEAESNSPEDASVLSIPLVKTSTNIGSEEIIFLQKHGNDVNSKYQLVEEKGNADSSKTDDVSETRLEDIHKESSKVSVESEEQSKHQPERYSIEEKILKHRDSEGLVTTESIPNSSEHEDESMSTIPELEINHSETTEKIFDKETYKEEEESTAIDNDHSCTRQNEIEETSKALEAIDETQFMGKETADNEHADHQSKAPSIENVITKHSNSEEKLPTESSIKSNYDEKSLEKIPESYSVDDGKIMPEKAIDINEAAEVELQISEARSEPEDGTLKTLSTKAYVGAEELENKDDGKFTQEKAKETEEATEMQLLKSATDSPPEDKDQSTVSTSEIVKGHTDEISKQQTHKNDETSVIDTEKSSAGEYKPEVVEKLDNEAKAIEEAIETQLLNNATESLLEEEVQLRLPTPAIVQHDTNQIVKHQPLNQDESKVIDDAKSCIAEKELDRISTVIEEPVQLETKDNISIVKEQTDQQSEGISIRSLITNYVIEGHITSDSSTKLTDDVQESHSIKNLEKKEANEITAEEATDVKQSTIVEIPKSEIEGVYEDKALERHGAELVQSKAVDESHQEDIKPEANLAVTYANEEQTLQHELDPKEEIPEEETCQLTAENEQKSEPPIAAQNNETTCIKHPYLDGETADIYPSNDAVEQEEVTMSHIEEKPAIEDDEKFNQEELKGTEKEATTQLPNTTTESLPEEEIQIILSTPSFVQGDIDHISQQQKLHNDESEAIDNAKSCIPEIELDSKSTIVEKQKGIEDATETQLREEEIQKRSSTPTFVQGDTDQIPQQETLPVNKSEVIDNVKQICIPEIELDGRSTVVHETEKLETKDKVSEILEDKDAHEIRAEEGGINAKQLTDVEIPKSETEGVAPDEALQPIPNAVSIENEANNESSQEEKQSEAEFTEKFNKEIQKPQHFIGETAEDDTTTNTEEKEEVPESHPEEKLVIKEEVTKTQLPDEIQIKSHTTAFVQGDNDQDPQQETSHVEESEVIDNAKKSCIPQVELYGKPMVIQEIEKPETKDNVGRVSDIFDKKDESDIPSQEGTDIKLTDVEIPKSETEGASKDEALQPIANTVSVGTKAVDESSQQEIQLEANVTVKSNQVLQRSEYVTEGTVEINATKYTDKQEGIENGGKFSQDKEAKAIEEASKMKLEEEKVETRSHVDELEVLDNAKKSYIPEIELDGKSIIVQENEKPETKDNVGLVTENLDNKDANDITLEEETDAKQLTNVEIPKSETKGVPKDEPVQLVARAVSVRTKADDENRQEEIQPEVDVTVKSNKEVQRRKYITEATIEIKATNYTDEQEQVPNSHVLEKEGIEGDGKFTQEEEAKGIEETTNMQLQEEEVPTRSSTPDLVQGDTNQIRQQETLHINNSEVIDNSVQSCIPENSIVVQETEIPETKDNVGKVTENLRKEDANDITLEEETDAKQLINVEILKLETEDEPLQPIAKAVSVGTKAHDENRQEEIQLETDVTVKSNEEVQRTEYITEETVEIKATNYTNKQEEVPYSHALEKEGIEDDGKFSQEEEAKEIEEAINMKLQEEEVPTRSSTPVLVQGDTNQILQQETLHINNSEVIDNSVQSCIPENSIVVQETEKPETEDNVGTVTENLDNKDANDSTFEEEIDAKQLTNVEIPKLETEGVPKDEPIQPIARAVLVGIKAHDENRQEEIQPEVDVTEKSTEKVQRPEYVNEETVEIKATIYTDEQEVVSNSHVLEKEGIEDDGKFSQQEEANTEKPETKENVGLVEENLDNKGAIDIISEEGTDTKELTDTEIRKSETEGVSKEEPIQSIARVVLVGTKAHDESSQEIQPEADVTVKSNKEVQTPEYVIVETTEINTNKNTEEQEEVPKSHAIEKEGIPDKGMCSQEEESKGIEESTKAQVQEEEIQTRSPTPAYVQGDNNQIPQQETLYIDESEVIDNAKQGCTPKIAQDIKSTIVQETEKPETKDTVRIVTEKLDNKDASNIRSEDGTGVKQLTNVEIPKSEVKSIGASKDETQQPIDNIVSVGTEAVDESSQGKIQSEADVILKSNKGDQIPEYVTEEIVEVNATNYTKEEEEVPTSCVDVKEGIEDDEKFRKEEESKGIEEDTKTQLQEEEVQTRSTTPAFVQGDTNHIPQQETLHVHESELIDNAKQSCIPAIELDKKTTVVQETGNPETMDKVSIVAENLDNKDATEIKAEEGKYAKKLTDVEIPKLEREGMPIDEAQQPIANAVLVGFEALDESGQEEIQLEENVIEKSNKEEQTPEYVTDEVVEINTTNYTEKQEEVPKSHAREKERIEDKFNQQEEVKEIEEAIKMQLVEEEVKGIEEAIQTHLVEEEIQTRSSTPASVQGDTNQIPQLETLHVDESEVVDDATIVQETEVSETKDSAGKLIENLDNKDASEIRAEEGIDAKQLTDLEMPKSETKEGIQDNRKFNQKEEENQIEEGTKMQIQQEEVQTSATPAFVKHDTDKNPQQITLHVNESNEIDNAKQSCIPEFEVDRNSTIVQETEVSEPKDNVDTVMENLDKEATKIISKEEIDAKQQTNLEIPKSEIEGVPKDEALKPIVNVGLVRTDAVAESSQQDKKLLEADLTEKSNKEVQTTVYVTEENVEININSYAEEKDNNPTHLSEEKEGIKYILNQEEKEKLIEEATKTHSVEEEVQTRSHTPSTFVHGDTHQIPHQETLHVHESELIDDAKMSCIPEIELDGKAIAIQETEVSKPKDIVSRVSENLLKKDVIEVTAKEEIDAKQLTNLEMPMSEIEGVPEDETMQPIANAVLDGTEAVEESSKQEIQPQADVTNKSNTEVLIQKLVTEEIGEINTNDDTEEQDKVQTSHAEEKEGTEDDGKLDEEEAKGIEEKTKTQFPDEEFQTRSPIPAFDQGDTSQILQQETMHIDESEVLDNAKQSCIPEIELDGQSTVVQETNNPETKDNVSTGAEIRAEAGTYAKQLTDVEIPKSETKGVPKDEALQPLANIVLVRTESVDEGSQPEIQPETNVTETIEINSTNYTEEQEKVPSSHAEEKGIKDKFNQEEEAKRIEEATKIQSLEEEVQTGSPTPTVVQGDKNQVPEQETLPIEGSEVINHVKESCIAEIELDGNPTFVQETEKPETKDNVNIITKKFDASEIRAEERAYDKQLTEVERPKSITEDEITQPIADVKSVGCETVEDSNQEQIQLQKDVTEKKSNKEKQTPQFVAEETIEVTTNNYTDEQNEVQTSHAEVKEVIEDDEKLDQEEEAKGIEEATKMKLPEEEVHTRSPTSAFVQGETDQILQQELLHVDELEAIDYVKQSCIPEIELDRKSTAVQETEKLDTMDNVSVVTEILDTNYASKIRAEEGTDTKKLVDLKMPRSEIQAEEKEGIKDIFNQEEKAKVIEETKTHSAKEEVQIRSPTPAFVQGDTNQILHQERLPIDEAEVIDNAKLSCIPETELDGKDIVIQKTEKLETKVNFDRVTKTLDNKDESENRAEEGIDAKQLTDLEMPKSETQVESEDVSLQQISDTILAESEAVIVNQEERQPQEQCIEKLNKDVQTPQHFTEETAKIETTNDSEEQEEVPASHPKEKLGIKDDGKFEQEEEEEKRIEEATKTQLQEEDVKTTLPTPTLVQGDFDQTLQQQKLHDDESKGIGNAKKSCTQEIELDGKSTIVEEPEKPETKDKVNIVKQEQENNQSEKSSIQRDITNNITAGLVTSESNRKLSDDVHIDEQTTVENLENKNASEIRAEEATEAKQSTYEEILQSETQAEPEDKALQTIPNASSIGNEGLDENSPEERQTEAEFTENFNKDVQTPQCDTKVTQEQQEVPASHAMEKLGIQDDGKFDKEELKGIEEAIETPLPAVEIQNTLPTPKFVQGDIDQMSQQQTLHDDVTDAIDNAKKCMTENELDRKAILVEEPKQPETKASVNLEKEEQADHQSKESSVESFITNYIIVERHMTSESNTELIDDLDLNEQKRVESDSADFLENKDTSKIRVKEIHSKQLTDREIQKSETEGFVENETFDETNQEEMQPEEEFAGTYIKDRKTPQSSMENVITKHTNSEGMVLTKNSTKSRYDEEERKKGIDSNAIENSEIKDGRKIMLEEASDIEATDVSEDKAISILSSTPSVRIGIADESIQEKIQKEVQPAVINTKEEQRPGNDFVKNMEVLEAFDLDKVPGNACVKNEEKLEVKSEANSQETIKKHPNLEELDNAEISPSSDTKELGKEREVAKLGGVSESVSVDIREHIDTGKPETQEAETAGLDNTKEDEAGDEFEKINPTSSVGVISRESQDTATKVLHKKSNSILSGVGSKVKHSISKVKKVITGKSSHPKTPPSSK